MVAFKNATAFADAGHQLYRPTGFVHAATNVVFGSKNFGARAILWMAGVRGIDKGLFFDAGFLGKGYDCVGAIIGSFGRRLAQVLTFRPLNGASLLSVSGGVSYLMNTMTVTGNSSKALLYAAKASANFATRLSPHLKGLQIAKDVGDFVMSWGGSIQGIVSGGSSLDSFNETYKLMNAFKIWSQQTDETSPQDKTSVYELAGRVGKAGFELSCVILSTIGVASHILGARMPAICGRISAVTFPLLIASEMLAAANAPFVQFNHGDNYTA